MNLVRNTLVLAQMAALGGLVHAAALPSARDLVPTGAYHVVTATNGGVGLVLYQFEAQILAIRVDARGIALAPPAHAMVAHGFAVARARAARGASTGTAGGGGGAPFVDIRTLERSMRIATRPFYGAPFVLADRDGFRVLWNVGPRGPIAHRFIDALGHVGPRSMYDARMSALGATRGAHGVIVIGVYGNGPRPRPLALAHLDGESLMPLRIPALRPTSVRIAALGDGRLVIAGTKQPRGARDGRGARILASIVTEDGKAVSGPFEITPSRDSCLRPSRLAGPIRDARGCFAAPGVASLDIVPVDGAVLIAWAAHGWQGLYVRSLLAASATPSTEALWLPMRDARHLAGLRIVQDRRGGALLVLGWQDVLGDGVVRAKILEINREMRASRSFDAKMQFAEFPSVMRIGASLLVTFASTKVTKPGGIIAAAIDPRG